MSEIQRIGESARWSDIVIYRGEAGWEEVTDGPWSDFRRRGRVAFTNDVTDVMLYAADLIPAGWSFMSVACPDSTREALVIHQRAGSERQYRGNGGEG